MTDLEISSPPDSVLSKPFLEVGVRNVQQFIEILFKFLSVCHVSLLLLVLVVLEKRRQFYSW